MNKKRVEASQKFRPANPTPAGSVVCRRRPANPITDPFSSRCETDRSPGALPPSFHPPGERLGIFPKDPKGFPRIGPLRTDLGAGHFLPNNNTAIPNRRRHNTSAPTAAPSPSPSARLPREVLLRNLLLKSVKRHRVGKTFFLHKNGREGWARFAWYGGHDRPLCAECYRGPRSSAPGGQGTREEPQNRCRSQSHRIRPGGLYATCPHGLF